MDFSLNKPKYVSLRVSNNENTLNPDFVYDVTNIPAGTIPASAAITYEYPFINKADDFVCAIERLELSLNGIPFYNSNYAESITVRDGANPAGASTTTNVIDSQFCLSDLLEYLSGLTYTDPVALDNFAIFFTITAGGFIQMTLSGGKTFTNVKIEFPSILNEALLMSTNNQINGQNVAFSSFPVFDCGDELNHIILRTDLPTFSDTIGNANLRVLTDIGVNSTYSTSLNYGANDILSFSSFTGNLRQKLIYVPTQRRFIDLVGPFQIQTLTIDAFYVDPRGDTHLVYLPYGCLFEIKIGFYKKSNLIEEKSR